MPEKISISDIATIPMYEKISTAIENLGGDFYLGNENTIQRAAHRLAGDNYMKPDCGGVRMFSNNLPTVVDEVISELLFPVQSLKLSPAVDQFLADMKSESLVENNRKLSVLADAIENALRSAEKQLSNIDGKSSFRLTQLDGEKTRRIAKAAAEKVFVKQINALTYETLCRTTQTADALKAVAGDHVVNDPVRFSSLLEQSEFVMRRELAQYKDLLSEDGVSKVRDAVLKAVVEERLSELPKFLEDLGPLDYCFCSPLPEGDLTPLSEFVNPVIEQLQTPAPGGEPMSRQLIDFLEHKRIPETADGKGYAEFPVFSKAIRVALMNYAKDRASDKQPLYQTDFYERYYGPTYIEQQRLQGTTPVLARAAVKTLLVSEFNVYCYEIVKAEKTMDTEAKEQKLDHDSPLLKECETILLNTLPKFGDLLSPLRVLILRHNILADLAKGVDVKSLMELRDTRVAYCYNLGKRWQTEEKVGN